MSTPLPKGQFELASLPRFGLSQYASRFPTEIETIEIAVRAHGKVITSLTNEFRGLQRVDQTSDFHCVTTWSKRNVRWSGVRFKDLFDQLRPQFEGTDEVSFVIFHSQDGYRVGVFLLDLLQQDVLLADTMNGEPLSIAHGAPVRLVMPSHYGYKNPKHVCSIEFLADDRSYRPAGLKFMDHRRGRVEFEERGRIVPGWLLRHIYRPLIKSTIAQFKSEMDKYEGKL